MRGKKPKRSTTPPSEDEGDDNFVADPDQIFDDLPQPFRLVDKTLRQVFDDAWEIIEGIEERKALKRSKAVLPLFELGKQLSEYNKSTCVCTVTDGGYLFLSYSNGLAVVDSLLGTTVACFEDPGNSIVQISACCLQEGYYLISTLDSVGFAKLFCFTGDKVLLVRTFNEQEGTNKQAVATIVDISQDGGYVGVGWKVPMKESWLEIYKVPKDTWVKEMEAAVAAVARSRKPTMVESSAPDLEDSAAADLLVKSSEEPDAVNRDSPPGSRPGSAQGGQNQPGLSVVSFTKPTAVLRVRPPAPVGPCAATNCSAALKATDADGNVIGSGSSHVLMSQYFDSCEKAFHQIHKDELQYLNKDDQDLASFPGIHFLTPGRLIPSGLESAPSKVNSLSVWWSGGTQLFIYSLVKTAKDLEHKPDIVWPHSEQIIISAVSECGSFMAMGLKTGTVVVWDVYRGTLLRVCPITDKGKIFVLCFLSSAVVPIMTEDDNAATSTASSYANLVVSCDDGTFCLLQCGVAHSPPEKPLVDRSAIDTEVVTEVVTMSQTPQVITAVTKSGRITLYDVSSCTAICHVGLPVSFQLSSQLPCICADGKVLMLIGAQTDEENHDALDLETSVPFSYPLQHFPTLQKYWKESVATDASSYKLTNTIDARLHSLIQDRLVSQESRQMRLQQRWTQYQTELKNIHNNNMRRNHSTWLTAKSSVFTTW
ncbi:oxidoreductase, acting on NAD(P)H [Desmophyllum pertusum]|uniref:Oxidoreductase, acting on NAD(P)H n=1 Tax=Desmophyllum pertusum TaxID=174260 RepID=A0A9W9ZSZ8_9CNID|nr:oxidoreductase, acting on NAD(P)H [Desmophyllum pertusum]